MNDTKHVAQRGDNVRPTAIGRRKRVYVRVTEKELSRIRACARRAGMSVSAYTRMRALGDGDTRPTVDLDAAELRKAFADLKHTGSNLNQCTRVLNTFGAHEDSEASAKRAMRSVSAAADSICALLAVVRG